MTKLIKFASAVAVTVGLTLGAGASWAQVQLAKTVDTGFMNVFPTASGGCDGYCFGSGWGLDAIKVTVADSKVTLQPNFNTYGDNPGDAYWRNNDGAGPAGNKLMEALVFTELAAIPDNIQKLVFAGTVDAYTLDADFYTDTGVADYKVQAFITINPGENGVTRSKDVTATGEFSVEADVSAYAGQKIQYGFKMTGLNANPDDEAEIGSVEFTIVTAQYEEIRFNENENPIPTLPLGGLFALIGLVAWFGTRWRRQ